ncbi:histone deacetylase family protein [Ahrensia sp. R2A130]|uniref:histone deacetylase family protein n=1 Tax=Ahrensia sp. R2A130 TaxID=744979 RepID=UPI0001E0D10E|nr:histone deacetylase family protein [Ahrensia sp. R2A130]EFL88859.1 type-2 histone deacetylase 1 [Ahrensia sp. R2A130]
MTTHLYTHDIFAEHKTPAGHPERPDRIRVVADALGHEDFRDLVRFETTMADEAVFETAHSASYVEGLRAQIPDEGIARIDPDTVMSPKSWECVRHAVGGGLAAVEAVMSGKADNAFLAARPPGHHAEQVTAMGFCFINTAAVMARHAQLHHGAERVAIVDFDVHHGNGTQDIFERDKSVFYASTHQMPLFPGTGAKGEEGVGNICNAPLQPGAGTEDFRDAFRSRVLPALNAFAPDLIIISAGFDAHARDPLANVNLSAHDFDWVTAELMSSAERHCSNRVVALLEGGYDLQGLAESCAAHVKRLMNG